MASTTAAERFWSGTAEHHDLAEAYDRHVEVQHPDVVRIRDRGWSEWMATTVTYEEYCGPSVRNL